MKVSNNMKKINKSQIVDIINNDTEISKLVINKVINSFINNFSLILKNSNSLYIPNIGEFYSYKEEPSKYTRNDRKYTSYNIRYTPSTTLIKTLNNTSNTTISL